MKNTDLLTAFISAIGGGLQGYNQQKRYISETQARSDKDKDTAMRDFLLGLARNNDSNVAGAAIQELNTRYGTNIPGPVAPDPNYVDPYTQQRIDTQQALENKYTAETEYEKIRTANYGKKETRATQDNTAKNALKAQLTEIDREMKKYMNGGMVTDQGKLKQLENMRLALVTSNQPLEPAAFSNYMNAMRGNIPQTGATNQQQPAAQTNYPTATNPQTGEKMIFKDGQWQKL